MLKRLVWPVVALMLLGVFLGVMGTTLGWCSEAADVAREQFGPRASLQKYEQFKDQAAGLDRLRANIESYKKRLQDLEIGFTGVHRAKWPRDVREQWSLWRSELLGIRAQYNSVAAQYNSSMAKFNYAYANRGELPAGAADPLPREYAPYLED
jgi:hypothetical protein